MSPLTKYHRTIVYKVIENLEEAVFEEGVKVKNLRQDLEINKYKDEAAKPTTSISEVQCMKNFNQEIKKTKDRVNVDVISSQLYLFLHLIHLSLRCACHCNNCSDCSSKPECQRSVEKIC